MKKIYWMLLVCFLFITGSSLGVLADEGSLLVELIFEDKAGNTYQTQVCAYESTAYSSGYEYRFINSKFYPYYHELEIDNLLLSVGSKGFHPSRDNYMTVRSNLRISLPGGEYAKVRVRVLNKKGKYIYQAFVEDLDEDGLFTFRWDGKATKSRVGVKKEDMSEKELIQLSLP